MKERSYRELDIRLKKTNVWRFTKEKREGLKGIYIRKKEINEQFGWEMNQNVDGNRKFYKGTGFK